MCQKLQGEAGVHPLVGEEKVILLLLELNYAAKRKVNAVSRLIALDFKAIS